MSNRNDHSERAQSAYRAYHIGENGKIETAVPIQAATDEQAVAQALELVDGRILELWDRNRLIIALPPRD